MNNFCLFQLLFSYLWASYILSKFLSQIDFEFVCCIMMYNKAAALFAMWDTWVPPGSIPGWEDPLEKGKATHCSILTPRIPWTV